MKSVSILVVGLFLTTMALCQSQNLELVSSSGESFKTSNYQLDWSIGEVFTATQSSDDYQLTQGLHQPTIEVTAVEDLSPELNLSVYPNPTSEYVTLDFKTFAEGKNIISITDLSGRILLKKEVSNQTEQLDFSRFSNGTYVLTVNKDNKLIKSFNIIKK